MTDIKIRTFELKDYSRQLKDIMDKNGNHTEANIFFTSEMEYYGKTLKWISKDFFNKLLHTSQSIISKFGNSWIRALICLIVFSIVAM